MKKHILILMILAALAPVSMAFAETFHNAKGHMAGRMRRSADGRTVEFYDDKGRLIGSAQRSRDGASTQYFDNRGRMSGGARR